MKNDVYLIFLNDVWLHSTDTVWEALDWLITDRQIGWTEEDLAGDIRIELYKSPR
jgi:hypothetical protein